MQRDMDLVRRIMQEIEKSPTYTSSIDLTFQGHTEEEVSYHVMLLHEAGLIRATDLSAASDLSWLPDRLTWEGHEFLEAAKNDKNWAKAKTAMGQAGGWVFSVGQQVLIEIAKRAALSALSQQP